ncbi:MAG TPA: serine/threonine-protein kinase [Polyangiaceae bacterium]|nr:serine/threonine-protein kinase [Polyangiaceae bacterium]
MSDSVSAAPKGQSATDPFVGRVIDERFKITGLIARGGMGRVYRAEQLPLGRACAVKVLNPNYTSTQDAEFHKRFFLEASIASKLTHPNTVTIFDYGRTDDDIYYMAMEYLDGRTLHRAIRQAGFFPEERAAHIARQICRALREAHSMGVIHRDLKPANILLVEHADEPDFVKVLDFGLVKQVTESRSEDLTQAGLFMGSPKYMAPEQVRGDRVDARTDIYALGVILYEMACGKVPFDRPNSVHILMAQVQEQPPPLHVANPQATVSPALEEVIMRCMAKDPEQRFRSMEEVLVALKLVSGISPIQGASRPRDGAAGAGVAIAPASGPSGSLPTSETGPQSMSASSTGLTAPSASPSTGSVLAWQQAVPKRRSRKVLATGIVMAAGIAGVSAYAAIRVEHLPARMAQAVAARAAPSPASAAPAPPPPPPPADLIVKVRISTDPDGATVKENGVPICSSTPCDVLYADADPSRVHEITLSLAGYRVETKAIRVGDSPIVVQLTSAAP